MIEKLESKTIKMKYIGRKILPSYYYASQSDLCNPNLRTAKPGEFSVRQGCYKSGKILSVRNYKNNES